MVGLDVTHQVILPVSLFADMAAHHQHPAMHTLHHAVDFYAGFYSGLYPHVAEIHGCFGHDVLAFVALTDPQLFEYESGAVRVAVDGLAQGQTMLRRKSISYPQSGWEGPASRVCMQVQAQACKDLIKSTLMRDWIRP
jgi:inosine-uridine nucleoside N-ribohydrolase